MTIPVINLKPKEDKRILSGHLWVFSNEIAGIDGKPDVGDVVEVKSKSGGHLGFGFYNPKTLIAVRIFSKEFIEPDKNFFINRLQTAVCLRQQLFDVPFYRLTNGESDFLPGLIIDRFDKLFSAQILSAAMEKRKNFIYDSIMELFSPTAIYERNESVTRESKACRKQRQSSMATNNLWITMRAVYSSESVPFADRRRDFISING